jgi:hypothetical protein
MTLKSPKNTAALRMTLRQAEEHRDAQDDIKPGGRTLASSGTRRVPDYNKIRMSSDYRFVGVTVWQRFI